MKTPENLMPFFTTEEAWTQESLPPCQTAPIIPTRKPTSRPASPKKLTQSKLPFTSQASKDNQQGTAEDDTTFHTAVADTPPHNHAPLHFPAHPLL